MQVAAPLARKFKFLSVYPRIWSQQTFEDFKIMIRVHHSMLHALGNSKMFHCGGYLD
uniref:Uncharacterized protein n=1 Tax=Kalanchoe fedtschenkoi TaxID=63787 RepID=A0A7N0U3P9_KALFE